MAKRSARLSVAVGFAILFRHYLPSLIAAQDDQLDESRWTLVAPSSTSLPRVEPPAAFNRNENNISPFGAASYYLNDARPALLQTNKFFSSFLIDGASRVGWALPYVVTVNDAHPFGMIVSFPKIFPGATDEEDGRLKWHGNAMNEDFIMSATELRDNQEVILTEFSDEGLSATIMFHAGEESEGHMDAYLVRGMAYATVHYETFTPDISSIHSILAVNERGVSEGNHTSPDGRFWVELNDGNRWIFYCSDHAIEFHYDSSEPNKPNRLYANHTVVGTTIAALLAIFLWCAVGCLLKRWDDLGAFCVDKVEAGLAFYTSSTDGKPLVYDTHFHYLYLFDAAAVVAYLRPSWATANSKNWVETLICDVNNPNQDDHFFPQFRSLDWFCGLSWARGLLFAFDGKDQKSPSEDVNFFYAMTMWPIATGNSRLEGLGRLQTGIVSRPINAYFLLKDTNIDHPVDFVRNKAEEFDYGGQGIAYLDTDAGNNGGVFRLDEDVDIKPTPTSGFYVSWTAASEYFLYTMDVQVDVDAFDFGFTVAAPPTWFGSFHVVTGGNDCSYFTIDLSVHVFYHFSVRRGIGRLVQRVDHVVAVYGNVRL